MGTAHQQPSFVQDRKHDQVPREPSLWTEENTGEKSGANQQPHAESTHTVRTPCMHVTTTQDSSKTLYFSLNFKILAFFFFFLAVLHSIWDFSSPTRDQISASCNGSMES